MKIIKYSLLLFLLLAGILVSGLLIYLLQKGALSRVNDSSIHKDYLTEQIQNLQESTDNPLRNVYFGDLHIHTSYSSDAYLMGVRTMPEDAYRFAKGEVIEHGAGYNIQISKPLDFAAVTDHSEYLGMMRLSKPDVPLETQSLQSILDNKNKWQITQDYLKTTLRIAKHYFRSFVLDEEASKTAWQRTIEVAEAHNQPNVFTTFVAYEWSSQPAGDNLHRNVIYRGGAGQVPERPYSSLDSENPEDLLNELKKQNAQGIPVLAIPHNGNLSNGRMYGKKDFNGQPMSEDYGRLRAELEPVSEIFQVKGASETHPILSNLDEFANFEIFESNMSAFGEVAPPQGSYARDALRVGMEMFHDEGFNPYKFGVIGSSDGHNASSPVDEDKFHGKLPIMDGAASLRMNTALLLPDSLNRATSWGSGGLAAVWSTQNTRSALFDAISNKETYATSGTRIKLRFFAAENFEGINEQMNFRDDSVLELAYQQGVPMGSDLILQKPEQLQFLVWAEKDESHANLDRIQVIKLWLDEQGVSHEKIVNVALSDGRAVDAQGNVLAVGNTVDVSKASYSNTIGDDYLQALWQDPEFKPEQRATYYARVLEIPTPRWSTYDALTLGIEAIEPVSIQERAVSSAIWYQP